MNTLTVLTIAGGVALILFGVRFLRNGLDRLFGAHLRLWIARMTQNSFRAFLSGIGIAVVAPSSTTLSMLSVQTIQAGHANLPQMLALVYGADIGMTITVALLAFHLEQYAPLLILVGVPFYQFTRQMRSRGFGQVIISIGFIFLGVLIIRNTAGAIEADDRLRRLLEAAADLPFMLAVIAAVITVVLQSSTATIGMMIGLAATGKLGINTELALAVVAGTNVGVAVTMLMIGWSEVPSRRLAWGNLMTKLVVALIVIAATPQIANWVRKLVDVLIRQDDLPAQIAIMHTGFNVVVALIGLPLVVPIATLTRRLVPTPPTKDTGKFGPRYITDGPIESVALALGQSLREILRVSEIVREMFTDLWQALKESDEQHNEEVGQRDDEIDLLDAATKRFLARLAPLGMDRDDAGEQMRQLRYLAELETIGDIIDKNLSELVSKKIRKRMIFSEGGWRELNDFHQKVAENMLIAETALSTRDEALAHKLLRHKERIDQLERELRDRHFERLNAGLTESHESSAVHLDLLTHMKRINSCVTHIAYAILENAAARP